MTAEQDERRMAAGVVRDLDRRRAGRPTPAAPTLNDGERRLGLALSALDRTAQALGEVFGEGVRLRLGVIRNGIEQAATDAREEHARADADLAESRRLRDEMLVEELHKAEYDAAILGAAILGKPRTHWTREVLAVARKVIADREETP